MRMRRGWLTLTIVLGSLLLSEAQVEFPLDYYSFPEIAQRMSVEGRKVECARELQQRLAIIRIKSRSWQQVRELLETALDVRFRKISDAENRWILERNPEVVRQERRWRERLAAYVETRRDRDALMFRMLMDKNVPVEEAVNRLLDAYREDIDSSEVPDEAQLKTQMTQVIEYFRKFPMDLAMRDWRAFQRMQKRFSEFMERDFSADGNAPFGFYRRFLAENPLNSFGFSKELLDWAQRAATEERDETLKAFREMMGNIGIDASADSELTQMLLLYSLGMFATGYGQAWARDTLVAQLRPPITVLETIEQGVLARDYTVALPPEQLAWHLNDVEGKLVPLNSPTPIPTSLIALAAWESYGFSVSYQFPSALPRSDFLGFVGGTIDDSVSVRWEPARLKRLLSYIDGDLARAYERAYEQHQKLASQPPVNQPFKARLDKDAPLVEVAYRWAQEQQQEVVMEALGVFRWSTEERGGALTQRLESNPTPYLLEQPDGVWILRCWSAFVERVGDYPLVAVRDLLRSDFSYEAWRRFYHAVTAEQARWLLAGRWHRGWNPREKPDPNIGAITPSELGAAWLVMAILESLPSEQRARLWNPPSDAPAPTFELARLPLEVRTRVAQTLALWRAALIHVSYIRERAALLAPPNTWMERLTLHRDGGWTLKTLIADSASGEAKEATLLETRLPGKPIAMEPPDEAEKSDP